jgi:hypothetical protein
MSRLDTAPPKQLVGDELINCFGEREMEVAVSIIIRKSVEANTWRIKLRRSDFIQERSTCGVEGFEDLILHGWLNPSEGDPEGIYVIDTDVVKRLKQKRPKAFDV